MKILKKLLSVVLALCMCSTAAVIALAAQINIGDDVSEGTDITEIDALLMASSVLNSSDEEEDILVSEETTANTPIPLYSSDGDVVAYYVTFNPTGYAVVNNNGGNPSVIEFGEDTQYLIEDILSADENAVVIYNNPTEVVSENEMSEIVLSSGSSESDVIDLYTYYPELAENNVYAMAQLEYLRQTYVPEASIASSNDSDWGFIDWDNMPSGSYSAKTITGATSVDWAKMSDYSSYATNHCGATAVTNLALYYAYRGYSNLCIGTKDITFYCVYNIVGKGPKMTIASDAKEYFDNCGYTLKYSTVWTFSGIKDAVSDKHPCGILLINAINEWHWVLCVGYRVYSSGGNYMRLVTGWDNTTKKFYLVNSGSQWWSATEYWVA